jgi:hypothetical protein
MLTVRPDLLTASQEEIGCKLALQLCHQPSPAFMPCLPTLSRLCALPCFPGRDFRQASAERVPVWCIRELLRQHKVGPDARWSKTKEVLAADERYKALPRDDRERLFRVYVGEQEVRHLLAPCVLHGRWYLACLLFNYCSQATPYPGRRSRACSSIS